MKCSNEGRRLLRCSSLLIYRISSWPFLTHILILLTYLVHYILDFYQPTAGAYFERWIAPSVTGLSNINSIANYPDCPDVVSHSDKFEFTDTQSFGMQYGRFRASFISDQTGIHKFFATSNNAAQIYIEMNPTGAKKILDIEDAFHQDWSNRYAMSL